MRKGFALDIPPKNSGIGKPEWLLHIFDTGAHFYPSGNAWSRFLIVY